MVTNYQRGAQSERYLMKKLKEEEGYTTVIRTAGSHSPCDVIGWNAINAIYCQSKRVKRGNKFYPSTVEVTKFKNMSVPVGSIKRIAVYYDERKRGEDHWTYITIK